VKSDKTGPPGEEFTTISQHDVTPKNLMGIILETGEKDNRNSPIRLLVAIDGSALTFTPRYETNRGHFSVENKDSIKSPSQKINDKRSKADFLYKTNIYSNSEVVLRSSEDDSADYFEEITQKAVEHAKESQAKKEKNRLAAAKKIFDKLNDIFE